MENHYSRGAKLFKKLFASFSFVFFIHLGFVSSASAAYFSVWTEGQLVNALQSAKDNGGSQDIITLHGAIYVANQIDIQTPVVIQGASGFRVSKVYRSTNNTYTPLFNIQSSYVTIQNLLMVDQNGQNTNTQVAAQAGYDRSNARLINIPYENAYKQISNIVITNNTFQNTPVGIASSGLIPRNLTITNNDFNYVNRSVELLRDVGRVHNIWNVNANNVVLNGGYLNISNNHITGNRIRLGISVDAGNDGYYVPHSFNDIPFYDSSVRHFFSDKPVVFANGSHINSNSVNGANEFGIALATVANITVAGNWIQTSEDDIWSDASVENNFTAGINVEHSSRHIYVDANTVVVGTSGKFATGINVLAFQDHGAPLNHGQASKYITLSNNTIKGTGANAILAFGYENLTVNNNNLAGFSTRNGYGINVSFYNVPCGNSYSTSWSNNNFVFNNWSFNGTGNAPQYYDPYGNIVGGPVCY